MFNASGSASATRGFDAARARERSPPPHSRGAVVRRSASTSAMGLDRAPRPSAEENAFAAAVAVACGATVAAKATRAVESTVPMAVRLVSACACAAVVFAVARIASAERRYADALVSHRDAADADGSFINVDGVDVHYKRVTAPAAVRAVECMHGFGANVSSWTTSGTLRRLSETLCADVSAHDSCGFGLTQRSKDVRRYTRTSDARACRAILREMRAEERRSVTLVGHSLGAVGAALASAEGGVDHVVLVAPAILGGKLRDKSENARNRALPVFLRVLFAGIAASATSAAWCLIRAVEPIVILVLRALVRSERFWIKGLRSAVHASRRDSMASDWVDGYRRPSIVRGWDAGMFRVVLASVAAANSPREIWRDAMVRARAPERPSAIDTEDALNALADSGASVLIVHGENDVIVPASNSRALAKLLGAELKIVPACGHMPHEKHRKSSSTSFAISSSARRRRYLSYCTSTTLNQRATHFVGCFILSASIFSFDANSGNLFSKPGCAAFHSRDFSANDLFSSSLVRTEPLVCSFAVIKDKNPLVIAVALHAGFQLS